MPRYKNPLMQQAYESGLAAAEARDKALFSEDGRQRRGSSQACAFWDGYAGKQSPVVAPGNLASAFYAAGKEYRRRSDAEVKRGVGKPSTGAAKVVFTARLSRERAEKARKLGVAWLEAAIDAA